MTPTTPAFSLVTFNCFGGLNWTTPRRLRSLARELQQIQPDVVCLQEVQSHWALRLLQQLTESRLAQAYLSGRTAPLGALLTLTQQSPGKTSFTRYTNQGAWLGPTLMDQLTQKGMLLMQTEWAGQTVIVINTHLVANYWAKWQRGSRAAQEQQRQLHQLADLVQAQPTTALVLVAGDFNIPRGSWLYEEFLQRSGLTDPLAGDVRPTYRPFPGVPVHYALPIDFVFLRIPPGMNVQTTADLCFTETCAYVGGGQGYLSDHVGVQVTLNWSV